MTTQRRRPHPFTCHTEDTWRTSASRSRLHGQAEVRRGRQAGTRRSPRSARRRCWSASSGDPNNSPRSPSKASARTSTAAATASSGSSATTWSSRPTCSPTDTRARGPARVPAPDRAHLEDGRRCRRSSTTAGPASFPADRLGEYRFRIVAVARRARDLAARLRQEARGRRRLRPRPRRGRAPRGAAREAREPRATAPRWRRGSNACAAASTGRRVESLDRLVTIGAARRRPGRRDPVRRRPHRYGSTVRSRGARRGTSCSRARRRPTRPSPGRSPTSIDRLPYVAAMGFDVLYLPPIHPIGDDPPQGTEQRDDRARRATPGARGRSARPTGGHTAVHPDLGTVADCRTAGDRGPRARHRGRARPRVPVRRPTTRGSPSIPSGSGTAPTARSRTPRTRRSATRTSTRSTSTTEDRDAACGTRCSTSSGSGSSAACAIFRVDNPHTKPFAFWEWLIAPCTTTDPDVIFLAEAFTRPRVMERLAKIGFTQSYTYFTWRNDEVGDRASTSAS